MTVGELKKKLEEFDDDVVINVCNSKYNYWYEPLVSVKVGDLDSEGQRICKEDWESDMQDDDYYDPKEDKYDPDQSNVIILW